MVWRDVRIRRPLRVTLLLPLLAFGAVAALTSIWTSHRLLVSALTEQALARAEVVVNSVDFAAETVPDLSYLQRQVAVIGAERDVTLIVVAAGEPATVVASTRRAWLGLRPAQIPDPHVRAELQAALQAGTASQHVHRDLRQADFVRPLQLAIPSAGRTDLETGAILMYLDLTAIDRDLTRLDRELFITGAGFLLFFGVAAYILITRTVIRPAEALARVMHRQAGGDTGARVGRLAENEIGALAHIFDDMLEAQAEAATELERYHAAMAESEAKLKAIVDNAPALISIKDLDGNLIMANARFDLLDLPPLEQLAGKNIFDLFPRETATQFWQTDLAALRAQAPIEVEESVQHRDGSLHTYLTIKFPLTRGHDEPFGICAISTDISERKAAEQGLRASEHRLRVVLDNLPNGVLENDLEGCITYCNPAFRRMLGFRDEELATLRLWELFPDPEEEAFLRRYLHMLASGAVEPEPYLGKCRTRRGESIDVQLNWSYKRDSAGHVVGIISLITDVTEKTRAEAAIRESQGRLASIVSSAMDAIVTTDERGNIILFNSAAETIFGYRADEVIGKSMDMLLPEAVRQRHPALMQEFVHAGTTVRVLGDDGGRILARRASGEEFAIEASISQSVVAGKRYLTAILRDISARVKAEEEQRLAARVFESSREAIIIMDAGRHIVAANRAFARMSGLQPRDVIGDLPHMLATGADAEHQLERIWSDVVRHGVWQGEVWNRHRSGEVYPAWLTLTEVRDAGGEVTHYIGQFFDISERKEAEARIQRLAFFDALTDLPNRVLLADRMRQSLAELARRDGELAILFIDLDRFKNINDSLGHVVGDALLQAVAERLRNCVRETDTIARLGGDEFIVMLPGNGMDGARQVAQKFIDALSEPFLISGFTLNITPSIGISLFPTDGRDADTLLRNADAAMYHAKDSGRATYRFFREELNANALERLRIESQLRQALENNELSLHFQPQVDVHSGRVVGAEALLRWNNAELGAVSPARFIPVAEDSGLIVPIGRWVIQEACRVAARWHADGFDDVVVGVNLSALQFKRDDIVKVVRGALGEAGLAADALELELTESMLLEDFEATLKALRALKQIGVRLSIDDFGTGYSSMSYLKTLDIDKLKIDQSFVRDLHSDSDDEAIVRAIIQMAHSLQLATIAEGVEQQIQLDALKAFGCDEIQGYLISRPRSAEDFAEFLRSGRVEGKTAVVSIS